VASLPCHADVTLAWNRMLAQECLAEMMHRAEVNDLMVNRI
jgi:hypothetical protein